MNLDRPCTQGEAAAFARALQSFWPHPVLDQDGQSLLRNAILGTRHPADLIESALRQLQQTHASHTRPTIPEINLVARGILAGHAATTRVPAADPDATQARFLTKRETLGELANVTMTAIEARARFEHRVGRRVESLESGSMRHISSIIGIGPFTTTGQAAAGETLARGLLAEEER